jgi:hypothetical protein
MHATILGTIKDSVLVTDSSHTPEGGFLRPHDPPARPKVAAIDIQEWCKDLLMSTECEA